MVNRIWNMCVNLRWVLCALHGRLPGQRGKHLHFATAPKELNFGMYTDPSLAEGTFFGDNKFAVSDVFFAEVAIIFSLCTNRGQLLQLQAGDLFECDGFDEAAYHRLVRNLISGGPVPSG